jgi:hypothetical protein
VKFIDLTGKAFGYWIVIKRGSNNRHNKIMWVCRCKCGTEKEVLAHSLLRNKSRGCTACRKQDTGLDKVIDLTGQKFSSLTVIQKSFTRNKRVHWLVKCDCGNEKHVTGNSLKRGNTKSCGCMAIEWQNESKRKREYPRKYEPRIASARRVYKDYSDGDLSFDEFLTLSRLPCHYCGSEPSNRCNTFAGDVVGFGTSQKSLDEGTFIYNGLDRVDSSKLHNKNNVVPCCKNCNLSKRDRSYDDFVSWIKRAYHHLTQKETDSNYLESVSELALVS